MHFSAWPTSLPFCCVTPIEDRILFDICLTFDTFPPLPFRSRSLLDLPEDIKFVRGSEMPSDRKSFPSGCPRLLTESGVRVVSSV